MIPSNITNKFYDDDDLIRVINTRQAAFYWSEKGIKPVRVYPTNDYKTGEPIIAYVFSKDETRDAYKEWISRRENK